MRKCLAALALAFLTSLTVRAQLPPVPVPPENPITEEKRVLGKILFWDEQLSSDGTVACGSCHSPAQGGADGRIGLNPGPDGSPGTPDDIIGSPGVARADRLGYALEDDVFGFDLQVTGRSANTAIGAAYPRELFWDGRAGETFLDPETGQVSIPVGGALESQAVVPILSDVEMAYEERTWADVTGKLASSAPLGYASDVPPDVGLALQAAPTYPDLFQQAFGDTDITAERIGMAIATYERTLAADQTPWDLFVAGDQGAMTPPQVQGWNFFRNSPCSTCHVPPLFTDNTFRNIGLRPPGEDPGRQDVTGLPQDRGRFKVPTLRNVGLKGTHMHNGRLPDVRQSIRWYRPGNPDRFADNLDPILPVGVPPQQLNQVEDFIANALTDPRVAAEEFPFDRPTLHDGRMQRLAFSNPSTLGWPALSGAASYNIYRGALSSLADGTGDGLPDGGYGMCASVLDPDPTDTTFVDNDLPASGEGFFYLKTVIDTQDQEVGLGATANGAIRWVIAACE